MDLPHRLRHAVFVQRLNRFTAQVRVGDEVILAHVANSGRLRELLVEGAEVRVHPMDRTPRVTRCDLVLVKHRGHWVSVDSRAPETIAAEAFWRGLVAPVGRAEEVRREVALGDRRIDLLVRARGEEWLVEVKGCTLVSQGVALFPDAPTARGRRHVDALAEAARRGRRTMVLFVVQRNDARWFRAYGEHDPGFAEALRKAEQAGVLVVAHRCRVTTRQVELAERLEVATSGPGGRPPCA